MDIIIPLIALAVLIPYLWKHFGTSVLTLLAGCVILMLALFTLEAGFVFLGAACILIGFPIHLSRVLSKKREEQNSRQHRDPPPPPATRRCPNCGSTATIRGKRWECGHCGDSGYIK